MHANEKLQSEMSQMNMHSLELVAWESFKNRINGVGGGVKNLTGVRTLFEPLPGVDLTNEALPLILL
jgi:hypothetical protein